MSREVSPALQDALNADAVHSAHLFSAVFTNRSTRQDEVYYATDNAFDVEWDGDHYPALGTFLGYEGVEENSEMAIGTARVSLSGVEPSYVAAILAYAYINRTLSISRVVFDADGRIMDQPMLIHEGPMDEPVVTDDPDAGTVTVTLSSSNHFAAFERRPGRHCNHGEQQAHFLGDRFFESFGTPDRELTWGR